MPSLPSTTTIVLTMDQNCLQALAMVSLSRLPIISMIFCIRKAAVLSGVLLTCSSETPHTILSRGLNSGELDSKMSFSEGSSRLSHHQPWILVFFGLKHSTFGLTGLLVNFPGRLKIIRETCGSNVCIQVLIILKNSALFYAVRFQFLSVVLPVQSQQAMMALVFSSFFLVAMMKPYVIVFTSADSRDYFLH
jgi:hypothetical protein